jgi:hypothetical protein
MPPVTRDVALVVIGAVFTLLGLIGNIRIKEFILEVSKVQRCSLAAIGVILLASGIFADNIFPPKVTAISAGANPSLNSPPSPPQSPPANLEGGNTGVSSSGIVINQPANGDMVAGESDVSGSYDPSITNDIWVFVWPEKAPSKGWPQSDNSEQGLPCARLDGKWTVHCYFGGPPQSYRIVIYTATPAASSIIASNLRDWHKIKDYKGISRANLPLGLKVQKEITVRKGA